MGKTKEQPLFQFFALQLICHLFGVCVATQNRSIISITQPLRYHETIVSSPFRLGFFTPENTNNHYAGIMLDVPALTAVWVANRDRPLTDTSGTLAISEDGNLVVLNGKREILWSSNVSESVRNCTAQLLDTGNLVLKDSSGRIIWESFQILTDSLLRRMSLSAKENLSSWSRPSDPAFGNFTLGFVPLLTPQIFIWNKKKPYWRSGPWNGKAFIGVPEMDARYRNGYEVINAGLESAYFTFRFSTERIKGYYYFQLTSRGALAVQYWESGTSNITKIWSSDDNQCNLYGICGPFGHCNPQGTGNQICTCLPEFEPKDKKEWDRGIWTAGCTRKKPLLQCDNNNSVGLDKFKKLTNMKPPDSAKWVDCKEEDCDSCCLRDCSCTAFAYAMGIGCMLWNDSLIDIRQFPSGGVELYIRVAPSDDKKWNVKAVVISAVVIGLLFLAVSTYIFWKCSAEHRGKNQDSKMSLFRDGDWTGEVPNKKLKEAALEELPLYSYETIANATDNFSSANKLGKGGFGQVYKGTLLDGQEIAVKRLSRSSCQGIQEFMNEVVVISKLQHRNLVRLLGCCVEREEKMLIYEHMLNRSLDAYLFDSSKCELLDWRRRTLIVEGIGRGLLYLHRDSRLKIIHRDLKASNILLDGELNPKISDFGLARIVCGNQDQVDTRRVVGTYGYMAPEYAMKGIFSEKSDVYSFGVLLLEIVSGRKNSSFSDDDNELSLPKFAWKLWNEGEAVKLIEPSIFYPGIESEILRYIHVGLLCVQEFARDRPSVSAILTMLNSEISNLPHLKHSAFTGKLISSDNEFSQQSCHSINHVSVTTLEGR